jgi:hypothetical protein
MKNSNSLAINEAVNFSSCLVEHQEFQDCYLKIKAVHRTYFTNPRGLMILGEPGVGKSKLARVYRSRFSKPSTDERTKNTILIVEMPPSCSIDWFYTKILAALGDPAPESGRIPSKELRIIQLFKAQAVELLIIDEIHNLLPGNLTGTQTQKMANILKTLMNTTEVPIVLLGEERAEGLILIEKAFESRFKKVVLLRNMGYSKGLERQNYIKFLASISKKIEVPCIALDNDDFAIRMYAASAGNVREMMHMVTEAIGSMIENKRSITLKTFAFAFRQISSNPMKLKINPFSEEKKDKEEIQNLYKKLGVEK